MLIVAQCLWGSKGRKGGRMYVEKREGMSNGVELR